MYFDSIRPRMARDGYVWLIYIKYDSPSDIGSLGDLLCDLAAREESPAGPRRPPPSNPTSLTRPGHTGPPHGLPGRTGGHPMTLYRWESRIR